MYLKIFVKNPETNQIFLVIKKLHLHPSGEFKHSNLIHGNNEL